MLVKGLKLAPNYSNSIANPLIIIKKNHINKTKRRDLKVGKLEKQKEKNLLKDQEIAGELEPIPENK